MKLTEYVPLAIRTEKPLPTLERFLHSCMGLITEIGEVTTELKRMAIYGKPLDAERKAHILEEIGDVMWYCAIALDALQADIEFVSRAPNLLPADNLKDEYVVMAICLGAHCGILCEVTQYFVSGDFVEKDEHATYLASLSMIMGILGALAVLCGSSLQQAMADNIAKLRIRYPNAYTNEAAEARADKNGADARVS